MAPVLRMGSVQRRMKDGTRLLNLIQDVYLDKDIAVA
jgi:hypothetical protein